MATDSAVGVPVRWLATEATKEGRKTMSNETEKLIEEAERLSKCASPGPWRRGSVHSAEEVWAAYPESIAGLAGERLLLRLNSNFTSEADTAFIARARTMVPELATALRLSQSERDEALKQSAGWEIQAQDLRDRLVKAEAERDAQHALVLRLTAERDEARVVHACPPKGSGVMPCCGATPFEKQGERLTMDPALVNCDRQRLIAENARLQREHDAYCRKLANYGLTAASRLQRELDAVRAENETLRYLHNGGR